MNIKSYFFFVLIWSLTLIGITIFSYTQVDLNLTLLNWQPYLDIQKQLTILGYFNRPLNSSIFLLLFSLLFVQYLFLLVKTAKNGLDIKQIWTLALVTSAILFFSYTIFSHDFFNYLFDARILTKYGLNPYEYKALDFPQDTWTRFMHWTHRNYPYGPVWLLITVIPSILGFGKLIITIALFKLVFIASYLIIVHYLIKWFTLSKQQDKSAFAITLFAFSPIILIDGLISPHLDIVMVAFFTVAMYYYWKYYLDNSVKKDKIMALIYFLLSVGVKYATILFFPLFFLNPKKITQVKWLLLGFIAALISVAAQSYQGKTYSWYFILVLVILSYSVSYLKKSKIALFSLVLSLITIYLYWHLLNTGIGIGMFSF
jgi:hypothetical protein